MFEAQPYLMKVWNCSILFDNLMAQKFADDNQTAFLLLILRQMINPNTHTAQQIDSIKSIPVIDYLNTLTLNKAEESEKQIYFNEIFGGQVFMRTNLQNTNISQHENKVATGYIRERIDQVTEIMEKDIFQHFVIYGEEGSGKMSFIELLSHQFHSQTKDEQLNNYIVITLEETFDSKNLVGTYVCNESGEFVFKKGPLTIAAEQGLWLILRSIEKTPSDLLSFLLPLVQDNVLKVTSAFTIIPKLGFRIFALCQSSQAQQNDDIKPFLHHLSAVQLNKLDQRPDFQDILQQKYPFVFAVHYLPSLLIKSVEYLNVRLNHNLKHQLLDHKQFSVRQIFKMFSRINTFFEGNFKIEDLQKGSFFLATNSIQHMIEEIQDIYLGYLYDKDIKFKLIAELVTDIWNKESAGISQLDGQNVAEFICNMNRSYGISQSSCYFGRSQHMQISKRQQEDEDMEDENLKKNTRKFVYTSQTLRTLEQVAQSIFQGQTEKNESVLLVGETGTGKTTSVQELSKLLNKKLHVFNMNQNTDSADLLGGFKPVDLKFLLKPIYEQFLYVFKSIFKSDKNNKFLDLTQKCYEDNKVKEFIQCLNHGLSSIKGSKKKEQFAEEIIHLESQSIELHKRAQKLENGGGFIFQFIEGTLIQSIKNGEWILLDEINLASESVLNRIATLVDGDYILLNERADIVETKRHKDFRIFFCMNPPYTSAGKKQLPWSLRSKLTEIYVPELDNQNDLWMIIEKNCANQVSEGQKRKILEFYQRVREQVFKQTKRGNIGLRNLSRALAFMKSAINLKYPVLKAIYDSLYTCFASHLDISLQSYIQSLILGLFQIKSLPELSMVAEQQLSDKYAYVEQFIIPKGSHAPVNFNERDFVTTKTFQKLLKQLASIVAVTDYAVILQGPTSAGKTSTVQYLANITHNKVIRINNHMHTDIQEYLGSYVPDTKEGSNGKLIFQEGVLVEAVRNGYWVILDELNLAPSEVLEALNRLLDDNRELLIVETQKVVKAHPNFRIFATQNPTEGYGGRKELSEAFKNRFILINVNEVPLDELVEILIHKCQMPKSRADLMVKVMENLQIYRSQGNLFSGKESTITVRDLLKWAGRLVKNQSVSTTDLALEGFLVLGERSRNEQDKAFIKQSIERVTNSKINEKQYFEDYFKKYLAQQFNEVPSKLNLPKLIQSQQLKRLAVLVHKCLVNQEPVLLVGETGCGKTTLCQVFAQINQQQLFSINCHQNTETSDFIGCMRTRKNLKQVQDKFQKDLDQFMDSLIKNKIINKLEIEEIINSKVSSQKQFQNLLKILKGVELNDNLKESIQSLKMLKNDLNCIFEWHDGILVESMQQGGLLLIDEISLANDSVLERLNSVFEADRTLVLSEKSSVEAVKIIGSEKFNMVATMNPSGDFGKKELSPALRNRMTEIWVESYFLQQELLTLYQQQKEQYPILKEINDSIDLYLIIKETAQDKLSSVIKDKNAIQSISKCVFNMIGFINFTLSSKYFALQRKSLSIRDILSMIDFIKVSYKTLGSKPVMALKHSINLVIIDGLCLGIDVAGDKQKSEIMKPCDNYLNEMEQVFFSTKTDINYWKYIDNENFIGVDPFLLEKKQMLTQKTSYAFDADTTKQNLLKLLRAYQLNKPILIEGPPGVGKTSLVENLAKMSGRKLIRVNLSEQTDMMDLLGSEYPVSVPQDQQSNEDEEEIRFHWCDGVLLRAIKEGYWFLIDEMNLAQQSVLEGLNAILDHRRTVYIPELNTEFQCHPDFFVFACQNPSQSSSSVGGRKNLPKSFLNRFNKIYLEELTQQDYQCIIERQIQNGLFQNINVGLLLKLSQQTESLIKIDSNQYHEEGAVNMRDLNRFLNLYQRFIKENNQHDESLFHAFQICYLQRLKELNQHKAIDLFIQSGLVKVQNIQLQKAQMVRINESSTLNFLNPIKPTQLTQKQNYFSEIHQTNLNDYIQLKGDHSMNLQFIMDCMNANIPLLIVSNIPERLIENLTTLSNLSGFKMNRILLNEKSDTSQLLGCFEQTSQDLSTFLIKLQLYKNQGNDDLTFAILNLEYQLKIPNSDNMHQIVLCQQFLDKHHIDSKTLTHELQAIKHTIQKGTSKFEWVDSVLIQSIEQGHWVIFENANLCNPSILDRLNPLLEEGNNSLCINEQGLIDGDKLRDVNSHSDFRALFILSEHSLVDQGRDVSRALRNRCLQLKINYNKDDVSQLVYQESKVVDMRYSQVEWDAQIIKNSILKSEMRENIEEQVSGLGKRQFREETLVQINQIIQYNSEQLKKHMQKESIDKKHKSFEQAYVFYLKSQFKDNLLLDEYLKQKMGSSKAVQFALEQSSQSQDAWFWFCSYKLNSYHTSIKQMIESKNSTILNKASLTFVQSILSQSSQDPNYLLLLREIKRSLKIKDQNLQNYKILYILSKSGLELSMDLYNNEDKIIQQIMSRKGQTNSEEIVSVIQRIGENPIPENEITRIKNDSAVMKELHQQPIKLCIVDIGNKINNDKRITLQALLDSHTVILMDENKNIVKLNNQSTDKVDLYLLQEKMTSAYLILIPISQSQIILSQSPDHYQSLCFLKDLTKVLKPDSKPLSLLHRHSHLSHYKHLPSLQKHFVTEMHLSQVTSLWYTNKNDLSPEQQIFEAVLEAENRTNFRDLPAYYLANSCLQRQIEKFMKANKEKTQSRIRDRVNEDQRIVDAYLQADASKDLQDLKQRLRIQGNDKANFALDEISDSLVILQNIQVTEVLETLFIIPLELYRLEKLKDLEDYHYYSQIQFLIHHLRSQKEAEGQCQPIQQQIQCYDQAIEKLSQIKPKSEAQQQLRNLLYCVKDLINQLIDLQLVMIDFTDHSKYKYLFDKCTLITNMLFKAFEHFFLHFNHLVTVFFTATLNLVKFVQNYLSERTQDISYQVFSQSFTKLTPIHDQYTLYLTQPIHFIRQDPHVIPSSQLLHEYSIKFGLKFKRMQNKMSGQKLDSLKGSLEGYALDYFVRREFSKRLKAQQEADELEALTYKLPFKMKVQDLVLENTKAYGDRTKEDQDKLDKEAKLEIERNFPSYFDEFQKNMFQGYVEKGENNGGHVQGAIKVKTEVKVESVIEELLEIRNCEEMSYKKSVVKIRAKMVKELFKHKEQLGQTPFTEQDMSWLIDTKNYLREEMKQNQLPSIMNVADVKLQSSYNFYHDSLQHEARLVYDPLMKLLIKINAIVSEWESPILNDALFLCNFILTDLIPKYTPLMKILTGLELIINKLEEWEVYASKSLNSCDNEMTLLKQLIIRYRKIQILSWRNLLSWKKIKMINEDFENMIRLAHTMERQVFDATYYKKLGKNELPVEMRVFELLDLFIRDSTLGQYHPRLKFLEILRTHFSNKAQASKFELLSDVKMTLQMRERLTKIVNILDFVFSYYSQFQPKLVSTVNRLDQDAREKVKTLIDVGKWSIQKFNQVKNNIDKTHRQLNKACKLEEEILMQNIASLILTASRKKYVQEDDQLNALNSDQQSIQAKIPDLNLKVPLQFISDMPIIKQLSYLQKKFIEQKWPDCQTMEYIIADIFERLKIVRDTNKKHIQRRAFADLLKYMKEQGLQQSGGNKKEMTEMLMSEKIINSDDTDFSKYYFKCHELFLMLDQSSQTDENSDLRNVDILRIRGFTQSMMMKIIGINGFIQCMKREHKKIQKYQKESQVFITQSEELAQDSVYQKQSVKKYREIVKQLKITVENVKDKMNMLDILDSQDLSKHLKPVNVNCLSKQVLSKTSLLQVQSAISDLIQNLNSISTSSQRHAFVIQDTVSTLNELLQNSNELQQQITESQVQSPEDLEKSTRKIQILQKYTQLFIQELLKVVEEQHQQQQQFNLRKESNITETTNDMDMTNPANDQANDDKIDLTIKEQHDFTQKLLDDCVSKHLPKIYKQIDQIFKVKFTSFTPQQLCQAAHLLSKLSGTLQFILDNQMYYIRSVAKFGYVTMRVFIYLIYQGFCGQDDKEEDEKQQQEDDKMFEQEGCGMGDGTGGQENVSKEIEHEEQLEGLKNYESDEEKKQEEKEDKKDEEGEQENDFEMKEGDFEGELEDVPKKEEAEEDKKDEDEDDDELDKVDDLLDNQLWNQNMEDLEQQQEEDDKEEQKKEQEEIDLGERELDKENQLKNQEKELKAGDRDKQEQEDKGEDKEQQLEQDQEAEDNDEEMQDDAEGQAEGEEEKDEIPLDRDSNVAEEDKQENKDEDMEDIKSETDKDLNEGQEDEDPENEEKDQQDSDLEGFEDNQKDQEFDQDINDENQDDEGQEEYKKDFNKKVLEDDKIESLEDQKQDQTKNEQANLKKQKKPNQSQAQQQNQNRQNQSMAEDQDQQNQFDTNGADILYQLANKIQQQQEQKQQQQMDKQKQTEKDQNKKTIEQPRMREDQQDDQQQQQQQQNDQPDDPSKQAMEYEFDEQAEQLQGTLATDKVEEKQTKVQNDEEEQKMQVDDQHEEDMDIDQQDEDIKQTQQQIQNKNMKQVVEQESDIVDEQQKRDKDQSKVVKEQQDIKEEDLIEDYQNYLTQKAFQNLDFEEEKGDAQENQLASTFTYDLDHFDYSQAKLKMRELFQEWMMNQEEHDYSLQLLSKFKQQTMNSSASLCEQLRIVLEPQLSQQLQGDYKTGKRLNMKKVISFIASHYRNDKIWLRRTMPSKRDYKILVAIDDSLSMKENNLGFFSLEALVTITEALNRLEVGKVAVAGIRERLDLFQSFEDGYSNERTAFIVNQFNFNYSAAKSADYAMANFVRDTNQLLDSQNTSNGDAMNCPFVIVLSDGKFNKNNVRPYLNEAREKKYLYIFVILDQVTASDSDALPKKGSIPKSDGSILSMKSVEKNEQTGGIKLVPYLRDFPFEYYCIVRDIHQLPQALGSILVQWFSLMSGTNKQ